MYFITAKLPLIVRSRDLLSEIASLCTRVKHGVQSNMGLLL